MAAIAVAFSSSHLQEFLLCESSTGVDAVREMSRSDLKITSTHSIPRIAIYFNWPVVTLNWSTIEWITKSNDTLLYVS
jgi:hypothetical protein